MASCQSIHVFSFSRVRLRRARRVLRLLSLSSCPLISHIVTTPFKQRGPLLEITRQGFVSFLNLNLSSRNRTTWPHAHRSAALIGLCLNFFSTSGAIQCSILHGMWSISVPRPRLQDSACGAENSRRHGAHASGSGQKGPDQEHAGRAAEGRRFVEVTGTHSTSSCLPTARGIGLSRISGKSN